MGPMPELIIALFIMTIIAAPFALLYQVIRAAIRAGMRDARKDRDDPPT